MIFSDLDVRIQRMKSFWYAVVLTLGVLSTATWTRAQNVVINEIMYHPQSENVLEEYVELFNRTGSAVDLAGWRFSRGIQFDFPDVVIPAGGYLVVAADVATFQAKYPAVANVVGNWTGILSNSREQIDLEDAGGQLVDAVSYADEGDWALRRRGPLESQYPGDHRGWEWFAAHDGLGKSLELVNADLPNDSGQNWASSAVAEGTPGQANSAASANIAPLILDTRHFPVVPQSSDSITMTARIIDEQARNVTVRLHHRVDGVTPPPFGTVQMFDDGAHDDGVAGDGFYGTVLTARPDGAVIEFYIEAEDGQGNVRTWPAAAAQADGSFAQTANALLQVDDTVYTGRQPLYKIIMTEAERAELAGIPGSSDLQGPNSQMNATFISIDGSGTELRYVAGVRNRGHGSRRANPPNYRVNFPSEHPWKNRVALNLNSRQVHVQHLGAVVAQAAGVAGANSRAVQVRVNNANLAVSGSPMYGSYAANEELDSDWADEHFPLDSGGNIYRAVRDIRPPDFDYRGEDKDAYTNTWFKTSNVSEDDWSDLISMLRVMGPSGPVDFNPDNVRAEVNVEQWLRHLAVMSLYGNNETGLNTGYNDDYFMYRGVADRRFILLYYDLDTILGESSSLGPNASIFGATQNNGSGQAFDRFMHSPDDEPLYYEILQELIDTTFSAARFNALVDHTLGDYVPTSVRDRIKSWMDSRRAFVQSAIAGHVPGTTPSAKISGEPRSPTPSTTATLAVGGEGVTHYRYRVNNGSFGAEFPVTTPIELAGLVSGQTYRIFVIGRNEAGVYQDSGYATPSRSWTVDTAIPPVRLNEVLARNVAAEAHDGTFPDAVELYNESANTADLSGLRLTDDPVAPGKFVIPPGTTLAGGGYLVLYGNSADGTPGLHLGFSLNATGEGLYLYDRVSAGGALLDSVSFGLQLPDLSIGRLNNSGDWVLTTPTFGSTNIAQAMGDPGALKINEWLALGQSPFADDFLELYNPAAQPIALGNLYLTDEPIGVPALQKIPALSFIAARGYTEFVADGTPEAGADHVNFKLSGDQGKIALLATDLSTIDYVAYGPQHTLISEGRCADGEGGFAFFSQPTPGAANICPVVIEPQLTPVFDYSQEWQYQQTGSDLGTAWREPGYNDSAWPSGPGLLGQVRPGGAGLPAPLRTDLSVSSSKPTFYFRTRFNWDGGTLPTALSIHHVTDDGLVLYLNGQEIYRFNMPSGPVDFNTLAIANILDSAIEGPFLLPPSHLVTGENVLAAEVHQQFSNSADIIFGLQLDLAVVTNNPAQAGLVINEVLANNATLAESDGSTPDWAELYNPSSAAVDLSDMSLSDSQSNPRRWVFPAGSVCPAMGYRVIRFDAGAPVSSTNTGFGLKANGQSVYLFDKPGNGGTPIDSISFGLQTPDFAIGRLPNGGTNWTLTVPTAGSANIAATLANPSALRINEWMASPSSGDDWFELYNPAPQPVALGGLHLTDDLNDRFKYRVPDLSFLGALTNAFQVFHADQNVALGPEHTNFKLSGSGESLELSSANGAVIDTVVFGPQMTGVSQGRLPDGGTNIVSFPDTASQGESNFLPLDDVVVNEVLTHSDPPLEDAIELFNLGSAPVDLSGWYLSDSMKNLKKFTIPAGTVIAPGGFKVFYESQFNPDPAAATSFSLSSAKGDDVSLSQATADGELTGYRATVKFGPAANGVSFGRFVTSVGADFVAMSARTFGVDQPATVEEFRQGAGLSNAYPVVGPVVISELMYHPATTNDALEYIELHNNSAETVPLFDPAYPTNTWRLRKAVDFDFPPNISLPADGYLLIVSFDPLNDLAALAAFQSAYGSTSTLVGPYSGKLDNGGESVELYRPDVPETLPGPDMGLVPYYLADRVHYDDQDPWPANADGSGDSLQRKDLAAYGNDPVNWIAAPPTPGPGGAPNDSDADGLPDDWEIAHGLNPNDPSDALADSDGDGLNNLEEYVAGTDPHDGRSYLKVGTVARVGGNVTIAFVATAGKTYSVQSRDSLSSGNWVALTNVPAQAVTQTVTVTDTTASGSAQRFYSVVTPASP